VNPLVAKDFDELLPHVDEIIKTIILALREKYGEEYSPANMLFVLAVMIASIATDVRTIEHTFELAKVLWGLGK